MSDLATMRTINGKPVLRFERRLRHAPEKVWRAITEPAELAHWFPAAVELEPRPGAPMRFTFPDGAPVSGVSAGEVLEFDPPRVFMFRWNADVLRFELHPDGAGCRLVFTQTLGGGRIGRLGAARTAGGWDACLANLTARLAGVEPEPFTDWLGSVERYIEEFGLGEGEVHATGTGYELRFARDLVWKPVDEVWAALAGDTSAGPPARAVSEHAPAGRLTRVEAPHLLEYEWLHDGAPAGRVRWAIESDPMLGVRVELTQTVPAELAGIRTEALAAWRRHLDRFFAAVHRG
jgi:uncharacterized protein YndB with AHSA1/START domain